MGIYSRHVLPRLLEAAMHEPRLGRFREPVLAHARGRVLEIGFGTGANLPWYPEAIRRIETVEPDPAIGARAAPHIAASGRQVITHRLPAERLPFEAGSFDTVVSTFTLCSIPDVAAALGEVARVLRPDGQFLFLEHGLAPDPGVARWQHRLTPLQKRIGGGCHLDRPVLELLARAGLRADPAVLEARYAPRLPRVVGWFTSGVARPAGVQSTSSRSLL
jgi:SAM-dependent methyltransferase